MLTLASGQNMVINSSWLIISAIGVINSFGAYCQWRAFDISLSKTGIFTQGDDVIAITLGYLFLNETKYLNEKLAVGIIICLLAATALLSQRQKANKNVALLGWVAGYSLIWGMAIFFMRYFALQQVDLANFMTAWYCGSFIGSLIIFCFTRLAAKNEAGEKLSGKSIGGVFLLALAIWASQLLAYMSYRLAPLTVAQPVYLVSEAILYIFLGLYYFKEIRQLTKIDKIAFAGGIAGIIIIALSF